MVADHPEKIQELFDVLQDYARDKNVDLDVFGNISIPTVNYMMPENVFWSRVRKEILTNPVNPFE
ncbi:MAG: hypothetical protein ACYSUH_04845 [Planctomycetota bacterium]|jgi:hypothetical protein